MMFSKLLAQGKTNGQILRKCVSTGISTSPVCLHGIHVDCTGLHICNGENFWLNTVHFELFWRIANSSLTMSC